MNKPEATEILHAALEPFRTKSYAELRAMIGADPHVEEPISPSGLRYQIEIEVCWDDKADGFIRVLGSVDDEGWRAFLPLGESFLKNPANGFVDEYE